MTKKKYKHKFKGYEVELPIKLNADQKSAVQKLFDFIESPSSFAIVLQGYAGTGKTTLMKTVADRYQYKKKFYFSATTHKAAAVLKESLNRKNVYTVFSLFGIMVEVDMDGKFYDMKKKKRTDTDEEKITRGSIVVIDEASMLNEVNYVTVMRKCKEYGCKIIFIGDPAQLSPVNESQISAVFRDTVNSEHIELTKIERTDSNEILKESMLVRETGNFSYDQMEKDVDVGKNGVHFIKPQSAKSILDKFVPGLKTDPNYFRILSYTNQNVKQLNQLCRRLLNYEGLPPQVGEVLMGYQNWGYEGKNGESGNMYRIMNSESYLVTEFLGSEFFDANELLQNPNFGVPLEMEVYSLKVKDALGNKFTIPYVDIKAGHEGNALVCRRLAQEKSELWWSYKNTDLMREKMSILDRINNIDNFLLINDDLLDDDGHTILMKTVDFGYAHTIHKSQGSSFKNVLINDDNINKYCRDQEVKKQLKYVGVTRAVERVFVI